MQNSEYIIKTPWDSKVLGIDTYELKHITPKIIEDIKNIKGHFTIRTNPLFCKKILHDNGFYYCDTLIEPFCSADKFKGVYNDVITLSREIKFDELIKISDGTFVYDRFHRDFHIDKKAADLRYSNWLKQFYQEKNVIGLMHKNKLAGFWCVTENKIWLHALSEKHRGKGLAKYFWSSGCKSLFDAGHNEILSSISCSNMPVLNLYAFLGFKFRNPLDIYHKLSI